MQPRDFYHQQLNETRRALEKARGRRNALTGVKIALFAGMLVMLYLVARREAAAFGWGALAALGLFIRCNIAESKLLARAAFLREREKIVDEEMAYLDGERRRFDGGEEFRDPAHPYSHDLDLFGDASVFQSINRTVTPHGKKKLAGWLASPTLSPADIRGRQEAAREMAGRRARGIDFRAIGRARSLDALAADYVGQWAGEGGGGRRGGTPYIYALPAAVAIGWALCGAGVLPWSVPLAGALLMLCLVAARGKEINRAHARLDLFIRSFGALDELVALLGQETPRAARSRELHDALFGKGHDARAAFASLRRTLEGFDQRGNILAAIVLNGLYMKDLHLLARLARWQEAHAGALPAWIEAIGEIDALESLANHAFNHPGYATPAVQEERLLDATALGHPLLPDDRRVANDFRVEGLHQFYIITGANMSGKSTFLRAVGVNLVMAHCGCAVCADAFAFRPTRLFTSMRATDDLSSGTSYFLAELLRLKQLAERARGGEELFVILDEMLKGTNSVDKLNGSLRFLGGLRALPVAGIIATHDLQLGELATLHPGNYFNRCFEIAHEQDDIVYDYALRDGVSKNMNASILLEKMGLC
ncbi:MAG: DNA mismatch repair protein MutS [Odoribacteraceae bacterium]|nr:DNA mismatch repair protein MutS [Odoribacteraceae bacterium]